MAKNGLTNKQQRFIDEYFKCWNATEAAIRAGYSKRSARQIGSENLSKPSIASRVRARMRESAMDADEVLYHLASIARGDMDNLIDRNGLPDIEQARATGKTSLIKKWKFRTITTEDSDIHEVEVEPYDRLQALNALAKVHKLTTAQQIEHSGQVGWAQFLAQAQEADDDSD